jgi:hypothetical protein
MRNFTNKNKYFVNKAAATKATQQLNIMQKNTKFHQQNKYCVQQSKHNE